MIGPHTRQDGFHCLFILWNIVSHNETNHQTPPGPPLYKKKRKKWKEKMLTGNNEILSRFCQRFSFLFHLSLSLSLSIYLAMRFFLINFFFLHFFSKFNLLYLSKEIFRSTRTRRIRRPCGYFSHIYTDIFGKIEEILKKLGWNSWEITDILCEFKEIHMILCKELIEVKEIL